MSGGAPTRFSGRAASAARTRATLPGTRPAGPEDEAAAAGRVREMFGRIAPRYDLLNHLLSLRLDVAWRRRVARRFRNVLVRPEARVLDLCCGTGDLALVLAQEAGAAGAKIMGADFAHPMVVRARGKSERAALGARPVFIEADALALPFANESFDLLAAAFGFRNLANYAAGLAEIRRVLRSGGEAAILEFAEPRGALLSRIFHFYFHRVLPGIGGLISGDAQAYGYLPASVSRYPDPEAVAALMSSAGFSGVQFERWMGGLVTLHTGRR
jgi:demethylmenaquinone methyltransferase / 2-methoxy-6-polyprenyl-1,4-benzoquinol methylase